MRSHVADQLIGGQPVHLRQRIPVKESRHRTLAAVMGLRAVQEAYGVGAQGSCQSGK